MPTLSSFLNGRLRTSFKRKTFRVNLRDISFGFTIGTILYSNLLLKSTFPGTCDRSFCWRFPIMSLHQRMFNINAFAFASVVIRGGLPLIVALFGITSRISLIFMESQGRIRGNRKLLQVGDITKTFAVALPRNQRVAVVLNRTRLYISTL